MRKLLAICLVRILSSCASQEEKFVNPMFYKTMEPYSKMTWQTRLTPTEIHRDNGYGYSMTEKCKLLENTQTKIVMHCIGYTPINEKFESIYGFELLYPIEDNGLKVRQTEKAVWEKDWSGRSYLYIDTSKE